MVIDSHARHGDCSCQDIGRRPTQTVNFHRLTRLSHRRCINLRSGFRISGLRPMHRVGWNTINGARSKFRDPRVGCGRERGPTSCWYWWPQNSSRSIPNRVLKIFWGRIGGPCCVRITRTGHNTGYRRGSSIVSSRGSRAPQIHTSYVPTKYLHSEHDSKNLCLFIEATVESESDPSGCTHFHTRIILSCRFWSFNRNNDTDLTQSCLEGMGREVSLII